MHVNAGIAGLVGALILGTRIGCGREPMAPHSLGMSAADTLRSGRNGSASIAVPTSKPHRTVLAMMNTFAATAAAGLSWMLIEWAIRGKPTLLGLISGSDPRRGDARIGLCCPMVRLQRRNCASLFAHSSRVLLATTMPWTCLEFTASGA